MMYKLNFPVETTEAQAFWASRIKANRFKAICAFSTSLENANDNLRRYGINRSRRKRIITAFGKYVNKPAMSGIPFSDGSTPWWKEY